METAFSIFAGIGITIYLLSFFVKNIVTAKRTGQSIKGKSWKVKVLIFIISTLYTLTYVCIFLKHDFLFNIGFLDSTALKVTGIVLIGVALVLGLSTLITMRNSWRMGITQKQNTELILNGFFRFSRNPYFLSYILIFAGVFFMFPTILFLVLYIPTVILIHLMILDEEEYLAKQHGESYLDYMKSVNRYISLKTGPKNA